MTGFNTGRGGGGEGILMVPKKSRDITVCARRGLAPCTHHVPTICNTTSFFEKPDSEIATDMHVFGTTWLRLAMVDIIFKRIIHVCGQSTLHTIITNTHTHTQSEVIVRVHVHIHVYNTMYNGMSWHSNSYLYM